MRTTVLLLPMALGCYQSHDPGDAPEIVAALCDVATPQWDLSRVPNTEGSLDHDIAVSGGEVFVVHVTEREGADAVLVSISDGESWREEWVLHEEADLRATRIAADGERVVVAFVRDFVPCLAERGLTEWSLSCFEGGHGSTTQLAVEISEGRVSLAWHDHDEFVLLSEREGGGFDRSSIGAGGPNAWRVDLSAWGGRPWLLTTTLDDEPMVLTRALFEGGRADRAQAA